MRACGVMNAEQITTRIRSIDEARASIRESIYRPNVAPSAFDAGIRRERELSQMRDDLEAALRRRGLDSTGRRVSWTRFVSARIEGVCEWTARKVFGP